jgi:hypothetical protein
MERARWCGGNVGPVVGNAGAGVGLVDSSANRANPQGAGPKGHPVPLPVGRPQGGEPANSDSPGEARAHGPAP